jgi:hypothetical protein
VKWSHHRKVIAPFQEQINKHVYLFTIYGQIFWWKLVDLITKFFKYLILMIFCKKVDHVQLTANKKHAKLGLISILPNCSFLSIISKKNRLIDLLISLTYDIYNHLIYTLSFFLTPSDMDSNALLTSDA